MTIAVAALAAACGALLLTPLFLRAPPERLVRTNINGRPVPAVLGFPLVGGSLAGLLALMLVEGNAGDGRILPIIGLALVVMGAAGWWDDLRGDERERGFRGHLRALARGDVTGGLVKIAAGVATGALTAFLVSGELGDRLMIALIVPLGANLVNLFDRAPGRAGKVALVLVGGAAMAGPAPLGTALAAPLGALVVVLGWDLREKGMLGDAGANAIGAVAGVGAGLALDGAGRGFLLGLLLVGNLASERWSFSNGIQRSRIARSLDMLGRRRSSR